MVTTTFVATPTAANDDRTDLGIVQLSLKSERLRFNHLSVFVYAIALIKKADSESRAGKLICLNLIDLNFEIIYD